MNLIKEFKEFKYHTHTHVNEPIHTSANTYTKLNEAKEKELKESKCSADVKTNKQARAKQYIKIQNPKTPNIRLLKMTKMTQNLSIKFRHF